MKVWLLGLLLCVEAGICCAESVDVYIGTAGKHTEGIYHAQLDVDKGVLTAAKRVVELQHVNFLAMHPNGGKFYAVAGGRVEACIIGFEIQEDASLKEFTRLKLDDLPAAHISVHPTGKFLLTAHYTGSSVWFFPSSE